LQEWFFCFTFVKIKLTNQITLVMKEIELPINGIKITIDQEGSITSGTIVAPELYIEAETQEDELYNASMDGLTSMILACACAGVDVESPQFLEAIETSINAISSNA